MTEDTKNHISSIIEELDIQRGETAMLTHEATQDYIKADEVRDIPARVKAFKEMECYSEAYAALRRTITILRDVKEGKI